MDRRQPHRRTWRTRNKLKQAAAQVSKALEMLEARQLLAADVVISEIMFHPSSNDDGQEYVELFNKGDATANLTSWQFDRGVTFTFSGGSIPVGGRLVVAGTPEQVARSPGSHTGVALKAALAEARR